MFVTHGSMMMGVGFVFAGPIRKKKTRTFVSMFRELLLLLHQHSQNLQRGVGLSSGYRTHFPQKTHNHGDSWLHISHIGRLSFGSLDTVVNPFQREPYRDIPAVAFTLGHQAAQPSQFVARF